MRRLPALFEGATALAQVFAEVEAHVDPDIEEIEEAWGGGIVRLRQSRGRVRDPSRARLCGLLAGATAKRPPPFGGDVRGLAPDGAGSVGCWQSGTSVGPIAVAVERRYAEAFRKFAGNRGRTDLVLVHFPVPADAVVMRGRLEEGELVIDGDEVSAHTVARVDR